MTSQIIFQMEIFLEIEYADEKAWKLDLSLIESTNSF